jgi:CRP/FNR family nitrogen fixation transcriptional regulator
MRNFDPDLGLGGGAIGSSFGGRNVDLTARLAAPGFVMSFAPNEEIYGEEEPADFVYRVVSGAVRTVRILSDGRRQVAGFHFAGDVFGLEPGDMHSACAEAVSMCTVALIKRTALERAADRDSAAARELWTITSCDLQRVQAHMLLLGRKGALERVTVFLLEMAARTAGRNGVDLPMSRTDIADYLGLTIETVSRSLTQLERDGLIALPTSRHIEFCNCRALAAYQA